MQTIRLETNIHAPPGRCFDLARSVDLHVDSTPGTGERAVAGRTSGLIGEGEQVTWEARHLGVLQRLTSKITLFDPPGHFRDSQVEGAFRSFDHDHFFAADPERPDVTVMTDVFSFVAPLGPLGWLAERLFLTAYMTRFLRVRAELVKRAAEGPDWHRYTGAPPPAPR